MVIPQQVTFHTHFYMSVVHPEVGMPHISVWVALVKIQTRMKDLAFCLYSSFKDIKRELFSKVLKCASYLAENCESFKIVEKKETAEYRHGGLQVQHQLPLPPRSQYCA
jgi:hypothetical protein